MTTHPVALVLLAVAVLALPPGASAARRLAAIVQSGPSRPPGVLRPRLTGPAGCAVLAAAVTLAVAGVPAGLLAAPPAGATVYWLIRRARRRRIEAPGPIRAMRLAAGWDLLAACLHSGMPVPLAVRAVADGARDPAVASLRATADLLALGADPAEAWAPARDSPVTAELARAACRTARSGTALAEVATALAVRVRSTTDDAAEAAAQRAGVLITGPLGLCFLPAFLCLGVIPVVLGLAGRLTVLS
ncbi:type II secretion system protein [Amycolatopsis antarctica]|uniref:Type II secretion system protein n=1 Tax=Amycolatopsis antarctica TaxID=1854586 RepID=A0A263D4M6_9PSEU|nr:type II secretion system F family protein [Amycolatopsis antarctica]OZM73403.1 type II secretion system protein [Amycolatopsis antarctica]